MLRFGQNSNSCCGIGSQDGQVSDRLSIKEIRSPGVFLVFRLALEYRNWNFSFRSVTAFIFPPTVFIYSFMQFLGSSVCQKRSNSCVKFDVTQGTFRRDL